MITNRQAVVAMYELNLPASTIAARLHLSKSYVNRIISEQPKTTPLAWNNCLRCDHAWPKRGDVPPTACPKCHSKLWSKPRKRFSPLYKKAATAWRAYNEGKVITPDPTPEEITAQCEAIRAKWSDYDRRKRYRLPRAEAWHPPVIDSGAVGFALSDMEGSPVDQDRRGW